VFDGAVVVVVVVVVSVEFVVVEVLVAVVVVVVVVRVVVVVGNMMPKLKNTLFATKAASPISIEPTTVSFSEAVGQYNWNEPTPRCTAVSKVSMTTASVPFIMVPAADTSAGFLS
jgi:hypothetical protein